MSDNTAEDLPKHPSPCPVLMKYTVNSVHHVLSAKEMDEWTHLGTAPSIVFSSGMQSLWC